MFPEINYKLKSYIHYFLKHNENKQKPYDVEIIKLNKLRVIIPGSNKLHILMFFDSKDHIRAAVDTDNKEFYTSLFYIEVIRKRRYNEAWEILKNRYSQHLWIDKFINFILRAPNVIDKCWNISD